MKPQLQLAVDMQDADNVHKLLKEVATFCDIIEIGTPTLKMFGMDMVVSLLNTYPNKKLLVDTKTMDWGEGEVMPFVKEGADIVTVLGVADIDTIKGVINAAYDHGKMAQVDLINVTNVIKLACEYDAIGADIIGIHTGIDQQMRGESPLNTLKAVKEVVVNAKVSVAGGINKDSLPSILDLEPDIVVVGGAITCAENPLKAISEIRDIIDNY